jgi:hypothetical protein
MSTGSFRARARLPLGKWRTARAEYQRGILDAIGDPLCHTIVVRSSAQVGKTEMILNATAFFVAQDPSSMLLVQPTLDMALSFAKDRLAPMVRDTRHAAGTDRLRGSPGHATAQEIQRGAADHRRGQFAAVSRLASAADRDAR